MIEFRHDDHIAHLVLRRPERRNALDLATIEECTEALRSVSGARVLTISGEGSAFCAGADLGDVEGPTFRSALLRLLTTIEHVPALTVAVVNGPALGAGTQLLLACDLVTAVPTARFGIPAGRLGLAVDTWTVQRLVERVGSGVARRVLLAAETLDSPTAAAVGLVHRIAPLDDADEWCQELATLAPLSALAHRQLLRDVTAVVSPSPEGLAAIERAWSSSDALEGPRAFAEKRPAVFVGS
jgi:enoyl-CoA hydratase